MNKEPLCCFIPHPHALAHDTAHDFKDAGYLQVLECLRYCLAAKASDFLYLCVARIEPPGFPVLKVEEQATQHGKGGLAQDTIPLVFLLRAAFEGFRAMQDARSVVAVERSPPLAAPVVLAALAPARAAAVGLASGESGITIIPWIIEHEGSLRVAENPPKGPETGANQPVSGKGVFRLTVDLFFGNLTSATN